MTIFVSIALVLVAVVVPSGVIAALGCAALNALGRNPTAAAKIFLGMALTLVFVEAISIISMLVIFQLFSL